MCIATGEGCKQNTTWSAPAAMLTSLKKHLDGNAESLPFMAQTLQDSWIVVGHGMGATNALNAVDGMDTNTTGQLRVCVTITTHHHQGCATLRSR